MSTDLTQIVEELRDPLTHDEALRRLKGIGYAHLDMAGATELVLAASGPFPPPKSAWSDTPSMLLYLARDVAGHAPADADAGPLVAAIERVFAEFPESARAAALQVLTAMPTPEAARTYARLVVAHAKELGNPRGPRPFLFPTFSTVDNRGRRSRVTEEVAAELFPALFPAASEPGLVASVYRMLLGLCEAGLVDSSVLQAHSPTFLALLDRELQGARTHQRVSAPGAHGWKYTAPYASHRHLGGIALDLAGWWNVPAIVEAVEGFGDLSDPRLRLLRAVSLMRLGVWVPPEELSSIAAHPRERHGLRRQMEALERPESEFPAPCTDQRLLAEGDMVEWLCFGTELGREPDEIELVHVESRSRRGETLDYFFFRFRVTEEHWSEERGWTVGLAGGYPRVAGGTLASTGQTFSKFKAWEEASLTDHVADYLS